jgi:hypothetical protein
MLSKKLSVENVGKSLKDFMGSDAIVTWTEKWCDEWIIIVQPPAWVEEHEKDLDFVVTNAVHDALLENVTVNGIYAIKKAVPEKIGGQWMIETEGSDMIEVAQLFSDVDLLKTTTNNIQEVARILGVEAALCLMQSELHRVLSFDGSYVDPRHTWLLADTVARSGVINPLNRHKMEELGGSLLQCASFEQTLDVFEHGAAFGKSDSLGGATEKLIVGQPVYVGTGSFAILETVKTEIQSSFVAPLSAYKKDFDTKFVEPLKKFTPNETYVKSLKSKQVIEIQKTEKYIFRALPNLPDVLQSECDKLSRDLMPLCEIMRKNAQLRTPVWITASIVPADGDRLSKSEFADTEEALEKYLGWTKCPNQKQFSQFAEVDYEVGKLNVFSRVEYTIPAIKTIHRRKINLLDITSSAPDPYDAWTVKASAISYDEISIDQLPLAVTPTQVKIIHEKLFSKGVWIIRLMRAWIGKNIVEAEEIQRGGSLTCSYEIQIELEKPWDLLEERGSSDFAISGGFAQRVLECLKCME